MEDSKMLKRLKSLNPTTDYPSNVGQKWTTEEEDQLLLEISEDIPHEKIAGLHKRQIGGITSRIRVIACTMYTNDVPMDEIVSKTKLSEADILVAIERQRPRRQITKKVVKKNQKKL